MMPDRVEERRRSGRRGARGPRATSREVSDVGDAVGVQGERGRQDDEEHHEVREERSDADVEPAVAQISRGSPRARSDERPRPVAFSSSTSCDACQKKRYGLIVVPRIATSVAHASRLGGQRRHEASRSTADQSDATRNAVIT